jgi:Fibronectin type III domain.
VRFVGRLLLHAARSCNGSEDGAVNLQVTGGVPPYRYRWSNNTFEQDLAAVGAGFYNVTVTDVGNCSTVTRALVQRLNEAEAPELYVETDAPSCYGGNDAQITATVPRTSQNDPMPVQFSLDGVNYGPRGTFSGLTPGSYTVYARNASGCVKQFPIAIAQPPRPEIVAIEDITLAGATVFWSAVSLPEVDSVTYNLQFRPLGSDSWATVYNISDTTYQLVDLQVNTEYEVRVQTACAPGTVSELWSEIERFGTGEEVDSPCSTPGWCLCPQRYQQHC